MTKSGKIYSAITAVLSLVFAVLFFPVVLSKYGLFPAIGLTALGVLVICLAAVFRAALFGFKRHDFVGESEENSTAD